MSTYRDEAEDTTTYKVVVNHEEQYSIWPADRENALGWKDAGKSGLKDECLEYIKEVWTDMRPLSLRKKMEEYEQQKAQAQDTEPTDDENTAPSEPEKDDLVERLCEGDHPVEVSIRPEPNLERLNECIERGYVHIKFTDTKGGTELGVRLDNDASDLSQADFDQASGNIRLVGGLTLNYVKVNCVADIDISTLKGNGHLELVEQEESMAAANDAT